MDVNTRWSKIKNAIMEAGYEVIGKTKKQKRKKSFDEECDTVVKIRNEKRMKYLQRGTR